LASILDGTILDVEAYERGPGYDVMYAKLATDEHLGMELLGI
jgi:hypothetical protein